MTVPPMYVIFHHIFHLFFFLKPQNLTLFDFHHRDLLSCNVELILKSNFLLFLLVNFGLFLSFGFTKQHSRAFTIRPCTSCRQIMKFASFSFHLDTSLVVFFLLLFNILSSLDLNLKLIEGKEEYQQFFFSIFQVMGLTAQIKLKGSLIIVTK